MNAIENKLLNVSSVVAKILQVAVMLAFVLAHAGMTKAVTALGLYLSSLMVSTAGRVGDLVEERLWCSKNVVHEIGPTKRHFRSQIACKSYYGGLAAQPSDPSFLSILIYVSHLTARLYDAKMGSHSKS